MCIQDWQIGRLIRSVVSSVSVGATAARVLTRNPDRIAVSFSSADLSGLFVKPGSTIVGTESFPVINALGSVIGADVFTDFEYTSLHFTTKDHGDLPSGEWYAIADSDPSSLLIVEYILPESVLYMTPEELRRKAQGK